MKTERYLVEVEMPDGDGASESWIKDALQNDADIEDQDRWRISVKEYWKPSKEQMNSLLWIIENAPKSEDIHISLNRLYEDLKQLKAL